MGLPFVVCGASNNVWLIGTCFFVSYVSRGVFEPMFRALCNQQIRPQHRASMISLVTLVSRIGSIVALVALGKLSQRSLGQAFAVAGVAFVASLPCIVALYVYAEKARAIGGQNG